MIAIQQSERNGKVVAASLVRPDDEVILISTGGVLIRTSVKSIREMSRSTQGVTLINLSEGEKLAGLENASSSARKNEPSHREPGTRADAMSTAESRRGARRLDGGGGGRRRAATGLGEEGLSPPLGRPEVLAPSIVEGVRDVAQRLAWGRRVRDRSRRRARAAP